MFVKIEERVGVFEERLAEGGGAEIEVEKAEVFAGGEEAVGFDRVVGEEEGERYADEGGGGEVGGEWGERVVAVGWARGGDGGDVHG